MNDQKRKITWMAFKQSGKWYESGEAFVDSKNFYFNNAELLQDIDDTQEVLRNGAITSGEFIIVVDGDEQNPESKFNFITRLIPAKD